MKKLALFLLAFILFTNIGNINAAEYDDYELSDNIDNSNSGVYLAAGVNWGFKNSDTYKKNPDTEMSLARVGFTLNVLFGYNLFQYLAIESEYNYGFKNNTQQRMEPVTFNNDYSSHSFFGNLVLKYPITERNTFFIKAGVGYTLYTLYSIANIDSSYAIDEKNTMGVKSSGVTFQVGAGYEFLFNIHESIIIAYNFKITPKLNVNSATRDDEDDEFTRDSLITDTKSLFTHSVKIAYKFTF